MALVPKSLRKYAETPNGNRKYVSRYLYATTDAKNVVTANGYFNDAAARLNVGDIVECACNTGGTPSHALRMVTANDGTTVTTIDLLA